MQTMKERLRWIDIMRGLAMLCIVTGHVFSDGALRRYLFSFHVPVFFFISGYCFSCKKSPGIFLKEKSARILVPYFVFSLLSIILFYVASVFVPEINNLLNCDIGFNLVGMIYGTSRNEYMTYNRPLWFLPCFFCVSVISYIFEKLISEIPDKKKNYIRAVFMFLCAVLGYFFSVMDDFILPWHLEAAFSMLVWFEAGIIFKYVYTCKLSSYIQKIPKSYIIITAIILVAAGIVSELFNDCTIGVRTGNYGNIFIYYLSAAFSISGIFLISFFLKECRILEYIGSNTMVILGLHKFPILFFQEIFGVTKRALESDNIFIFYAVGFIITVISVVVSLLAGKIIERIAPWIIGKKNNLVKEGKK